MLELTRHTLHNKLRFMLIMLRLFPQVILKRILLVKPEMEAKICLKYRNKSCCHKVHIGGV